MEKLAFDPLSPIMTWHYQSRPLMITYDYLWLIVKTPTQRQLNNNSTKVGFDTKMILHTTPQKLNVRNNLSCYWSEFLSKPQLNVNSTTIQRKLGLTWKWLCIPPHHPTHHRNSMSVISQLLLTRFWRNFKRRFMGLSWTDFNCHSNICPGNICPGDICPYQEYLSCYWPDFDQTLKIGSWEYL